MAFTLSWTLVTSFLITLQHECLGKSKLDVETTIQSLNNRRAFEEESTVKIITTYKNYSDKDDKQTPNSTTPRHSVLHASNIDEDETEKNIHKHLELQNKDRAISVSEHVVTDNKDQIIYQENQVKLDNVLNFWNQDKNNTKIVTEDSTTIIITTSTTTEKTTFESNINSNDGYVSPSVIEFINNTLGTNEDAKNIISIDQNASRMEDNDLVFQKSSKFTDNILNFQESKLHIRNDNKPLPYNIDKQANTFHDENILNLGISKQSTLSVNNSTFIPTSKIVRFKEIHPNELIGKSKEISVLVNEQNPDNSNIDSVIRNLESHPHSNKRELNDEASYKTISQLFGRVASAAASEFYPKITDIGQSSDNERGKNNVSIVLAPLQINKDTINLNSKSKEMPSNGKIEDWYANFFNNNMISSTLTSNNSKKENNDHSAFDIDALNNNYKDTDKSKESPFLEYNPILETHSSDFNIKKMSLPITETETEVFDINSFINNKSIDKSKELYQTFTPKSETYNNDFLNNIAAAPFQPMLDTNRFTNNDKNLLFGRPKDTDFLSSNPKYNNNNLPLLGVNSMNNDDYIKFSGKALPFLGDKAPKNFIANFQKNVGEAVERDSFQNDNMNFIKTQKDNTVFENYRMPEPHVNEEQGTLFGVTFPNINEAIDEPKIMPPFMEYGSKFYVKPTPMVLYSERNIPARDGMSLNANKNKEIERLATKQDDKKLELKNIIKGDNLRLIMNSLQQINQILAKHEVFQTTSSTVNTIHGSNQKNRNEKTTTKLNLFKQRTNKDFTKNNTKAITNGKINIRNNQNISLDLLQEIANSVKNIILNDMRKEIITVKTTIQAATTTTTPTSSTFTTTGETTTTAEKENHDSKDASYVVQKLMELLQELRSEKGSTTKTTLPPPIFIDDSDATKYEYIPFQSDHPPTAPAFDPYGIKPQFDSMIKHNPQTTQRSFDNQYNEQLYINNIRNVNKDNFKPQIFNKPTQIIRNVLRDFNQPQQMSQTTKQAHKSINQRPQTLYQVPPVLNQQMQIMNRPPQIANQGSQFFYQSPQMLPRPPQTINQEMELMSQQSQIPSQAIEVINLPPLMTNPILQRIYGNPQILNTASQVFNQPSPRLNQLSQDLRAQQVSRAPEFLNQFAQSTNREQRISNQGQIINRSAQMLNQSPQIQTQDAQKTFNQPSQHLNNAQSISNQSPQVSNRYPLLSNQPSENYPQGTMTQKIINHRQEIINQPAQISNRSPQMLNQSPQILNNAQLILNQALQMRNQATRLSDYSPQTMNQPLQMLNNPQIMSNQPLIINNPPETLNQQPPITNNVQKIYNQLPQITHRSPEPLNQQPQNIDNHQKILTSNQSPQISNLSPQMSKRGPYNINNEQDILNHSPQILNRSPEMQNFLASIRNNAQNIFSQLPQISNLSPQISNQPSHVNDQQEMVNQRSQTSNNYPQISNQPPRFISTEQEYMNQAQKISNGSPQTINQSPQTIRQEMFYQQPLLSNQSQQNSNIEPETSNQSPEIVHQAQQLTNGIQSRPYFTFQTNSEEIPPLGIPIDKPNRLVNQVIIVTTKSPIKEERKQRKATKRLAKKRKEREKNPSNVPTKLNIPVSLQHQKYREPYRNRSSKFRLNSSYRNYSGSQRMPYKSRYKKPDYEYDEPRYEVEKFHEQLERTEDWPNTDKIRSRERDKACSDEVASRQQMPLTKMKQRSSYDDTHFRNFLKTQEKVNDMLERILATNNMSSRTPRSVETP